VGAPPRHLNTHKGKRKLLFPPPDPVISTPTFLHLSLRVIPTIRVIQWWGGGLTWRIPLISFPDPVHKYVLSDSPALLKGYFLFFM